MPVLFRNAKWLAELVRHGLIRGSFIPSEPIRALRDLTRYRTSLIRQKAFEAKRLQKFLDGANIKLASVATDITGVSAKAMLTELLNSSRPVAEIAELAKGRLRNKIPDLRKALKGHLKPHHKVVLTRILTHIDYLDEAIAALDAEIEELMGHFAEIRERLDEIPGVDKRATQVNVAEIGVDVDCFPTAGHLASWAGMCPGNHESAGKRKSGRTTKGSPWLKSTLVQIAHASGRSKNTYLSARPS